ncbi:unnamed protein product [Microthlaspi erraticum]|uniref:F-box domain-containing protein n=1 Tax=Microthlaspi erraticum TaxID=1685480 RepID=A0A6D2IB78_9BRAS|nr:unnamed protein product [Microthlaspi erraticum]
MKKKTPNSSCRWSELPMDMLRQVLERLHFLDFHRAKIVCSSWYSCSKQSVRPKCGSPLLMLSLEEGGCVLYNPDEDRVYETTTRDFSGEERIGLPPLESLKGERFKVEVAGDKKFNVSLIEDTSRIVQDVEDLRGLLWVDDKNGDYVVVWQFECDEFVGYCKKEMVITVRLTHGSVLAWSYKAYVIWYSKVAKVGAKSEYERLRAIKVTSRSDSIVVKTSGEVLYVHSRSYETSTLERPRTFRVFKRDPKQVHPSTNDDTLAEVDSLGDEALFLDLGITVKVAADHIGIEPNSIYFTRGDRIRHNNVSCLDMCVYNLATKNINRFHVSPTWKSRMLSGYNADAPS